MVEADAVSSMKRDAPPRGPGRISRMGGAQYYGTVSRVLIVYCYMANGDLRPTLLSQPVPRTGSTTLPVQ